MLGIDDKKYCIKITILFSTQQTCLIKQINFCLVKIKIKF